MTQRRTQRHSSNSESCFRCRFVAALVLSLFLPLTVMCYPRTISRVPKSPTTGRRGPSSGNYRQNQRKNHVINQEMQCTESQSSFLRSQCGDRGFMTVTKNRVLVQTSGLSANHSEGKQCSVNSGEATLCGV